MKRFFPLPAALLVILSLFTGCSSYQTQVERGRSLEGVRHFFVVANSNDNRAIHRHIVAELTARGLQADSGPLTMMPEETAAIVSYQDHWTWDFGDHLIYLQINVRDRKGQPYGSATFSAKIPSSKPPARIAADLVGQIVPENSESHHVGPVFDRTSGQSETGPTLFTQIPRRAHSP